MDANVGNKRNFIAERGFARVDANVGNGGIAHIGLMGKHTFIIFVVMHCGLKEISCMSFHPSWG